MVSDPVPERGDIVTFWDEELNKVLVKRVVGLPGETLSFKNGYTYVNGEKLDESYLPTGITYPRHEGDTFTVPEGCIFLWVIIVVDLTTAVSSVSRMCR